MGFWACIKYALNSSLGTKNFEPLDQTIMYSKGLSASENNLYYTIADSETYDSSSASEPKQLKQEVTFKCAGSANLKFYFTSSGNYTSCRFYVYKNGSSYSSETADNRKATMKSIRISFLPNDVFTFVIRVTADATNAYLENLGIYAVMQDLSAIRVKS